MNADDTVTKGVFKDEEAGILTYTLREKRAKVRETTNLPKYTSIKDIYIETLKFVTDDDSQTLADKNLNNEN